MCTFWLNVVLNASILYYSGFYVSYSTATVSASCIDEQTVNEKVYFGIYSHFAVNYGIFAIYSQNMAVTTNL